MNRKTHFSQTTCNLWKVCSCYIFKRLIRSDDDWFFVLVSVIDNKEQIFFQPICRILHSEVIKNKQFNFRHIVPKSWIFFVRFRFWIKRLTNSFCYVCDWNKHHFCIIQGNQFVCDSCSSVRLSSSDISSKIQSKSFAICIDSFFNELRSHLEKRFFWLKVFKSFFFESYSDTRLLQHQFDFLHFILAKSFDVLWSWFKFYLCRLSKFTRTENWRDSISMNPDFFFHSSRRILNSFFAFATRWRCQNFSFHWLFSFAIHYVFEADHSFDFNWFACFDH